jgi:hypothetical protein
VKALKDPLDLSYLVRYTINMITIREIEQFKTWLRGLRDRVTQAIINAVSPAAILGTASR